MSKLLKQFKERRKQLKLTQAAMGERIRISQQQYQYLESKGNPRLDTLELLAYGLDGEILFIPKERIRHIRELLALSPEAYAQYLQAEQSLSAEKATAELERYWFERLKDQSD